MNQFTKYGVLMCFLTLAINSYAEPSSAIMGKALWEKKVADETGELRSCTDCHGIDITQAGLHVKTKKSIEPMAKSVTTDRYEDPKKIAKWFKRNCKWTWGRECTASEQQNILDYLTSQ